MKGERLLIKSHRAVSDIGWDSAPQGNLLRGILNNFGGPFGVYCYPLNCHAQLYLVSCAVVVWSADCTIRVHMENLDVQSQDVVTKSILSFLHWSPVNKCYSSIGWNLYNRAVLFSTKDWLVIVTPACTTPYKLCAAEKRTFASKMKFSIF